MNVKRNGMHQKVRMLKSKQKPEQNLESFHSESYFLLEGNLNKEPSSAKSEWELLIQNGN